MRIYSVGGAVRDRLMGHTPEDEDYVVVGANPKEMVAQGFRPVGKDFPVFIHPETGAEYALARTERKSGVGYKGFAVYAGQEVTLEEDLARRDLTINAMAQSKAGVIHDPYGGRTDLANKVLRHVGPAFKEDPVRILRLARFCARWPEFTVAPETMALVRTMVARGDLDDLVAERVWQELARGLMAPAPGRMLEFLRTSGALKVLIPELDALWGIPQPEQHHPEVWVWDHCLLVLEQAVKSRAPLEVRFACLLHDLGKALSPKETWPAHHGHESTGVPLVETVCARLKVPAACRDLAVVVCREHQRIHRALDSRKGSIIKLLMRMDAFRRPYRFQLALWACTCDARGRTGLEGRAYPQATYLAACLDKAASVEVASVVAACKLPGHIPERILEARIRAITQN